jgi:hypothetical protein
VAGPRITVQRSERGDAVVAGVAGGAARRAQLDAGARAAGFCTRERRNEGSGYRNHRRVAPD